MPCVSDYLEATGGEKELSRVLCLLGELKGIQWDKSEWDGYHAAAYNKTIRLRMPSESQQKRTTKTLCQRTRQRGG